MRYRDGEGTIRTVPIAWTDHRPYNIFLEQSERYISKMNKKVKQTVIDDIEITVLENGLSVLKEREIYDKSVPPDPAVDCQDCSMFRRRLSFFGGKSIREYFMGKS